MGTSTVVVISNLKQFSHTCPKNPFVCPKKGIGPPTFLFFSDEIGTLNPTLGTGLDS